ncbi:MAG: response regulator [Desulfobulbaceae bacterium]|nr:response regulator [Desulfobulbaceae bacterium]
MALRVLLIDDETEFVDTLAERLALRGYDPRVAYSGQSALQAVRTDKPDVVVLDMLMPGMPGEETLRRLKDIFPDLPVIVLSGHGVVGDTCPMAVEQAFACMTKPLALKALLEILAAATTHTGAATANGERL